MEAEIRSILTEAVEAGHEKHGLFIAMLDRFGEAGGVDLELPDRREPARAVELDA